VGERADVGDAAFDLVGDERFFILGSVLIDVVGDVGLS
jgi:hypothetical protein